LSKRKPGKFGWGCKDVFYEGVGEDLIGHGGLGISPNPKLSYSKSDGFEMISTG
jgi:hypothetical protein